MWYMCEIQCAGYVVSGYPGTEGLGSCWDESVAMWERGAWM